MQKKDDTGRVLVFTRSFCDSLVSFVYHSRSSYAAATSFLSSIGGNLGLSRQSIVDLGRLFTACLVPSPDLFSCPICGDNPDYIVIDGQALGFRRRLGMCVVRPSIHLARMNLNTNQFAVLRQPSMRAAIRKAIRDGEGFNKTQEDAIHRLMNEHTSLPPRRRTKGTWAKFKLLNAAATIFFSFFKYSSNGAPGQVAGGGGQRTAGGGMQGDDVNTDSLPSSPAASGADTREESTDGGSIELSGSENGEMGDDEPVDGAQDRRRGGGVSSARSRTRASRAAAQPKKPWHSRTGVCSPDFTKFGPTSTQWAAIRPFVLGMLGDPVVGLFQGHKLEPIKDFAAKLQSDEPDLWVAASSESNTVGFIANFFARVGRLLKTDSRLRKAVGVVLQFAVQVEGLADTAFTVAARKAAQEGQTATQDYCKKWGGDSSSEKYEAWVKTDPAFSRHNIDSPFVSFEYFGFLRRVRPAIFLPRAAPPTRRTRRPRRRRGKGSQAVSEDKLDRCSKAFPRHKDLTAGVFNVVCPHVVTLGFRVMFEAESVADALSVILERFPKLPKVVFYDVACKIDRNALQRVRTIMSRHGVWFCLDRVHAKGHTCSAIYYPDESLAVTNGVSTQAAEVQHSVSVKFRGHLAYMSPASFMVHRIAQLAFMNLTAAYKLHPDAKAENEDVRLNEFYFKYRNTKCQRTSCACGNSKESAKKLSLQAVAGGALAEGGHEEEGIGGRQQVADLANGGVEQVRRAGQVREGAISSGSR